MKAVIVVPTIREECINRFLSEWEPQFHEHRVIVVEDNPKRTFTLEGSWIIPNGKGILPPAWVTHVSWAEIDADLGADSWIIPRRTGAIRNYGMLLAGRMKPNMIVLLDDDCLPGAGQNFLQEHWTALASLGLAAPLFDTMHGLPGKTDTLRPRGFPREARKVPTALNHGLWNGVPDLDGATQLSYPKLESLFNGHSMQVPHGCLFPMSAMNVAFAPKILPAMYQLPMGEGQPYHRFDDIWCGFIMKKACDAVGLAVRSGAPAIRHVRASDPHRNMELEASGILENERVWRAVMDMQVVSRDLDSCLASIHDGLKPLGPYWERAAEAAAIWRRLVA